MKKILIYTIIILQIIIGLIPFGIGYLLAFLVTSFKAGQAFYDHGNSYIDTYLND